MDCDPPKFLRHMRQVTRSNLRAQIANKDQIKTMTTTTHDVADHKGRSSRGNKTKTSRAHKCIGYAEGYGYRTSCLKLGLFFVPSLLLKETGVWWFIGILPPSVSFVSKGMKAAEQTQQSKIIILC
uniref:Uncharacterized protein n=1 Tax=Micrurus surinamensis TaxID=129470 RepID=A0A2D4NNM7_MICSU